MAKKNETDIKNDNKIEAEVKIEASNTPPAKEKTTCKKSGFSLCKLSLMATFLVVVAIFTMPYWKPYVSSDITNKIDDVTNSIFSKNVADKAIPSVLDMPEEKTTNEEMSSSTNAPTSQSQDDLVNALSARIEQLENNLASKEASPMVAVDSESVKLALFKAEELKNSVDKLNKQYEELKNSLNKQGSETNSRILTLMDRNDNLKKDIEGQKSSFSDADKKIYQELSMLGGAKADASTVLSMVGKISSLESKIEYLASQRGEAVIMLLASSQLQQAVDKGEAYNVELKTLSSLGAGEEFIEKIVATLEPYAETGVKTEAAIKIDFSKAAYKAVWNANKYNDNEFLHRLHDKLTAMVKIRRTDFKKEEKPSLEGQIALAETFLNAGELANALNAIKEIENPKAIEKLQPWIDEASTKVSANKAISELTSYALAEVKAKNIKGE